MIGSNGGRDVHPTKKWRMVISRICEKDSVIWRRECNGMGVISALNPTPIIYLQGTIKAEIYRQILR